MEFDYDIYSYIVKGIGDGSLVPVIATYKVFYEIVSKEDRVIYDEYDEGFSLYKLQLIDKNGKKIYDLNNKPILKYVDDVALKNDFVFISSDRRKLKMKNNNLILIEVPETIKVPLDIYSNKNSLIKKGTWIDITNVLELKFYSSHEASLLFDIMVDDIKRLTKMSNY